MNKQKAQEVLINAVKIAVKNGVFELNDCAVIAQAVQVLTLPDPKEEKPVETKKTNEK